MKHYLLLGALMFAGFGSQASITAAAGTGNILSAGSGVGYTADFFGDATLVVHGWDEKQSFTLSANLAVDITTTGSFASPASLTPGFIPADTLVNSHSFYFDPATGGSTVAGFQFDGTIIGVILDDMATPTDPFVASDFLIPASVPAANIPGGHFNNRGLELGANTDHLTVSANTLTLFLSAGSPGDQVRVLTLAPEPGIAAFSFIAIITSLVARRRFWG